MGAGAEPLWQRVVKSIRDRQDGQSLISGMQALQGMTKDRTPVIDRYIAQARMQLQMLP